MNDKSASRTPAQLYALVFGATLVLAGILGWFYSSSFGSPGEVDGVLGILDVNGWHNIVHMATGVLGLLALGYSAARTYALGLGAVYVLVAIWGFAVGDGGQILSIIPVNTEDNILHLLIGLAGLGAYAATPAVEKPTTAHRTDATGAAA
ncbi:MAG TPA: DUF4383 domain-containing protein [Thermoleophilaceae bacterium]|jgi:hypothetical protein